MDVISDTINEVIKRVGGVIGPPLTVRIVLERLEGIKKRHKEIEKVELVGDEVKLKLRKDTDKKMAFEILSTIVSEMKSAYSEIIGEVGKNLVGEGLDLVIEKYKDTYPELKKIKE